MTFNKQCRVCKKIKAGTEFNKDASMVYSGGFKNECKACMSKRRKAKYAKDKESKFCPCCHETKPLDQFHLGNSAEGRIQSYCKACKYEYHKARMEKLKANPSKTNTRDHHPYLDLALCHQFLGVNPQTFSLGRYDV